jgi:hypothetical protein
VFSISQPVTFRFFGTSDPVPGLSVPLAFSAALSNALDNSTLLFARALSLVTCKLCGWFDKGLKPKTNLDGPNSQRNWCQNMGVQSTFPNVPNIEN